MKQLKPRALGRILRAMNISKSLVLIFLSASSLIGETYSIHYGKGKQVENCILESVNDSLVVIRRKPDVPRLFPEETIKLSELNGIRVRSSAENKAPCCGMGGVLLGISVATTIIRPDVESNRDGIWGFIENAYLNLGVVGVGGVAGGAMAYYGSMLLLGHELNYISFEGLSSEEKVTIIKSLKGK